MASTVLVGTNRNFLDTVTVTANDVSVARATSAWVAALPDEPVPDESEFYRWLNTAGNNSALLFSAIKRASNKQRKEAKAGHEMTAEDLRRYVTSVIFHEKIGVRKFEKSPRG
jgi:hypothetical protein